MEFTVVTLAGEGRGRESESGMLLVLPGTLSMGGTLGLEEVSLITMCWCIGDGEGREACSS